MYKLVLFFATLCLVLFSNNTNALTLSPKAKAYIITCAPSDAIYGYFGHSAIRIADSVNQVDVVYNYGTFDFETPYFYVKFTRGKLDYMISVSTYEHFKYYYDKYVQRPFTLQKLNLDSAEVNTLYQLLENNHKPENRFYRYDFFFDNCSSRLRDMLEKALPNKIIFSDTLNNKKTYRQRIAEYLKISPWLHLAIDVALGLPTDQIADHKGVMFLPDYLYLACEKATIKTAEGQVKPLVIAKNGDAPYGAPFPKGWEYIALWVFGIAGIYISTRPATTLNQFRFTLYTDFITFSIFTLAGLLVLLLWFGTEHKACQYNLNILWLLPIHAFLVFTKPKNLEKYKWIWLAGLVLNATFLLFMFWLPQKFNTLVLPLALFIVSRYQYRYRMAQLKS